MAGFESCSAKGIRHRSNVIALSDIKTKEQRSPHFFTTNQKYASCAFCLRYWGMNYKKKNRKVTCVFFTLLTSLPRAYKIKLMLRGIEIRILLRKADANRWTKTNFQRPAVPYFPAIWNYEENYEEKCYSNRAAKQHNLIWKCCGFLFWCNFRHCGISIQDQHDSVQD